MLRDQCRDLPGLLVAEKGIPYLRVYQIGFDGFREDDLFPAVTVLCASAESCCEYPVMFMAVHSFCEVLVDAAHDGEYKPIEFAAVEFAVELVFEG